jgi:Mce-associated membrane protein
MATRRSTGTTRRPRVAGLRKPAHRADGAGVALGDRAPARRPERADVTDRSEHTERSTLAVREDVLDGDLLEAPGTEPAVREDPEPAADEDHADEAAEGEETDPAAGRRGWLRRHAVPVLAAALAVLVGATVFFAVADHQLRNTPAARNTALVDVGATAQVAGQLSDALETVYSYDFARLDQNEQAAKQVITPAFATEFAQLFAQVRELAPQQKAVVSATVTHSAVKSIEGDRAVLVAFMDQRATRVAEGEEAEQLVTAGRVTVTGERVDGRWKIAAVQAK